jgi:hypothetical protein
MTLRDRVNRLQASSTMRKTIFVIAIIRLAMFWLRSYLPMGHSPRQ